MEYYQQFLGVSVGALALSVQVGIAQDQSLEDRVAALETQSSSLSFGSEIEIYGYAKGDLIYDFDSDLGNTIGGLGSLEAGAETGSNFRGHAFQSRLGVNYRDETDLGDLRINVEGDFFGGGGGDFRLRNAYGELGGVLVGQFWTNFMPIESYPSTLDFQGPAGIPFARVAQARYSFDAGPAKLSFSIEDPVGDSSDPALTAAASSAGDTYFVKAALLSTSADFGNDSVDGFGVNLSGNANLWEGGTLLASYTKGEAISSYLVFGGTDVVTIGGQATAVETTGLTLGIAQDLSDQFSLGLAYGLRENDQGATGSTESLETAHLSLFYRPLDNVTFGVEYITGARERFNAASVSADRLQVSAQFNF